MERTELVIIGAGQAGLATAYAARAAGLDAVVLEASGAPAGSWPTYYDRLRLFSPARYSGLPGRPMPGDPERYPTRDEVVDYLVGYADWLGADIRLRERVANVVVDGSGFLVETASGLQLHARRVVSATGGFGSPHRPKLSGLDTFPGRVLHSSDYRTPDGFRGMRTIVVGAGNSAIQIAAELASVANVTLTSRSPVRWLSQRPLGRDLHWWFKRTGFDTAPFGSRLSSGRRPVLDDGRYRAALERGQFDWRPMFEHADGSDVVWSSEEHERVDAIVMATGFRSHVPFLAETGGLGPDGRPFHKGGVSTTVPGLGYVGLEFQRSFSSATIRGVGRDAAYVLERLKPAAARAPRQAAARCCPALVR
jgi:putative flavoprotein involved in K+ transport